jgi:PST family polysaccharide transporter
VSASNGRLTEQTILGLAWTSLAMGAQAVLQLVALILLARLLQPSEFGLFAAAMVITGFCAIFSELGVGPAIVQRPDLEERHVRVGFTLSLLLSVAMGALVWLTAPAVAGFFKMPDLEAVVRVIAASFPLQGLVVVAMSLAQRHFRFRWLALVDAGAFGLGFVVVAPILTLLGLGIWALIGAYLAQQAARTIMLLWGQPHAKGLLLERAAISELLYFGAGFTLARVLNFAAGHGDNLVVGRGLGAHALGVYGHAYQLMAAPAMLVGQVLDRVLFPAMARVQLEPQRLARAYRSGISACALLMLPASIMVAVLAEEVVAVLLGPAWSGVALPLGILACGMLFRTSYKLSDTIARATGAVYARAWRQGAFALAVISGSAVGQYWGLGGVAWGIFAALGINFTLMAQLSLRLTGITWAEFGRAHLPGLVLAVIVGVGTWVATGWLRGQHTPPLLILLAVCLLAALLGASLTWLKPAFFLGPDARQLTKAVSNLVTPKLSRSVAE